MSSATLVEGSQSTEMRREADELEGLVGRGRFHRRRSLESSSESERLVLRA
ncbi:MAG: hypothetical protein AVDCRST_MAG45-609, partial [uncultured Solirubrobacterales bacterium]